MGTLQGDIDRDVKAVEKGVDAAKVLLNVEVTGRLPAVVGEGENAGLGTDGLENLLHGSLLLLDTGNSLAVGVTGAGPADLSDELALGSGLGADLGGLLELLSGEVTSHVSGNGLGEVGVDLDGEDVDVGAESITDLLPRANSLGGSDSDVGGEAGATELITDVVEVGTKLADLAVTVEDALVSDNDHGDRVLGGVLLDVVQLVVGVAGEGTLSGLSTSLEEDAVDDLQSVLGALRDNVLKDTAVSAVRADGGETELRDLLDVGSDLVGGPAVTVVGVRSVGNGPLVAVGLDVLTVVVAAGGLGLVRAVGGAGSGLGLLSLLGGGRDLRGVGRLGGLGNLRDSRLGNLRNGGVSWLGGSRDLGNRGLGDLRDGGVGGLSDLRNRGVSGLGVLWDWGRASGLSLLLSAGGGGLRDSGNSWGGVLWDGSRASGLGGLHGGSHALLLSAGGGRLGDSGNSWLGGLRNCGVRRCGGHGHLRVGGLGRFGHRRLARLRNRRVTRHGRSGYYGNRAGGNRNDGSVHGSLSLLSAGGGGGLRMDGSWDSGHGGVRSHRGHWVMLVAVRYWP